LLNDTSHIYYCPNCDSAFSGRRVTEKNCPECGHELVETNYLKEDWRSLSDEKKTEMKKAFKNGEYLLSAVQKRTVNTVSAADEILKFKELKDAGIISAEEFEEKKKALLK